MAWAAWAIPLAISVYSSIKQGQNESANQQNAAQVNDYNAKVSEQNASNAYLAASANEEAQRRKDAMTQGSQIASLAENGIDITSGTGRDLVNQSSINSELNALNIRYQGVTQARQYEQQAVLDRYGANTYRVNASNALTAGYLGAGSKALSGYSRYTNPGRPAGGGVEQS